MRIIFALAVAFVLCAGSALAASKCPAGYNAQHGINVKGNSSDGGPTSRQAGDCAVQMKNGFPVPDPSCTPGAFNPTVTLEILKDPNFRTGCIRDQATKPAVKAETYDWYGIKHPSNNKGTNQVCELDHFVPLELGGADTLDNIWPQCGPSGVKLNDRYFKQKDLVEDFLAAMVKADKADLDRARKCIAADWTQFLEKAMQVCRGTKCDVSGEAALNFPNC